MMPDFTAIWIGTGIAVGLIFGILWLNRWIDAAPSRTARARRGEQDRAL